MTSIDDYGYYREHGEDLLDLATMCDANIGRYRVARLILDAHRPDRFKSTYELPDQLAELCDPDRVKRARTEIDETVRHTAGYFATRCGTHGVTLPIHTGVAYSQAIWSAAVPATGSGETAIITRAELTDAELYRSAALYTVERHKGSPAAEKLRILYVAKTAGEAVVRARYRSSIRCSGEPEVSRPDRRTIETYASFLRSLRDW